MKITYTGRQVELAPAQLKKIETQFAKVGKLLDGREEKEAHVILSLERHLHQAEITVNYYNHQLVGIGSNVDLITAIHSAIETNWWVSVPTWTSSRPFTPQSRSWKSRPSRSAPSGGTPSAHRARRRPPRLPSRPPSRRSRKTSARSSASITTSGASP